MSDIHKQSHSESYAKAGVDVTAGYATVGKIKPMVESTYIPGVLGTIGGFGGFFQPDLSGMSEPVFVSGADGVGTKLRLAFALDKHDTIGIDCVAMCVNDIACAGAKPLFFLDYIGIGKLMPDTAAAIVSGIAEGCRQAGCALVGGETAEMPSMYADGEYDVAGFAVGMVDKSKILDGSATRVGDAIIGVASSGLHSNGFSLVRAVLGDDEKSLSEKLPSGKTMGEVLLTPTTIYVKAVLELMSQCEVHGMSNITGGGWYENIPRMLPEGTAAKLCKDALPVHEIFGIIAQRGDIPERDMYNTFNMGVGLCIAVPQASASVAIEALGRAGHHAAVLGEVVSGDRTIEIC